MGRGLRLQIMRRAFYEEMGVLYVSLSHRQ
jgi:hypothetical protein